MGEIHPFVTHFPIVLILTATLFQLIYIFQPSLVDRHTPLGLFGLSVISVAIILERAWFFHSMRDDLSVLAEDLTLIGPLRMVLYAESTALDTDFTARLCDVYPDGRSLVLSEGILRARYRHGLKANELLEPNEPDEFAIELCPVCHVFRAKHRLRLDISSSNFPRFSRNLNTGENVATGTRMLVAHQTVLHSGA